MPRQWNPCSYLPRRLQIVASLTTFVLICIIFVGTSDTKTYTPNLDNVPFGPQLQSGLQSASKGAQSALDRLPSPSWLNPFSAPAHVPPPEQANSTSGEARWYSDFKWRSPFSSSITLQEDRTLLPPEKLRPPVYTYFDSAGRRKDETSKKAEQELLQIWRRAWWAQGFKPVVLGRPEAMNNPQYRAAQGLELSDELEMEMMRWLAWGNMGTGILSNWLALPMAPRDDPLLTFLRRGEYPILTRYDGLENGLFVGSKDDVDKALRAAVANQNLNTSRSIFHVLPADMVQIDENHEGIAYYSTATIKDKYKRIADKLGDNATIPEGLAMIPDLINSHLHMTWQNTFSSGIAVLKPLPQHTTTLVEPAIEIARNLSQCPDSPIPASCPPNRPRCKPCVASTPMLITTPFVFRNTSTVFTIGTLPHPYTLTSLQHTRDDLSLRFVRRETNRDIWILAATKELLGTGRSSFARLVHLKDAVASDYGSARSLWLTAERPPDVKNAKDLEELDWTLGFQLPRSPLPDGKSETPVPGPERRPPPPKKEFGDGPIPSEADLTREVQLFEKAKIALRQGEKSGRKEAKATREVVEAWNLADTEMWRFVRAWNARGRMQRRKWEEEEEDFLGKGAFDRWKDFVTRDVLSAGGETQDGV